MVPIASAFHIHITEIEAMGAIISQNVSKGMGNGEWEMYQHSSIDPFAPLCRRTDLVVFYGSVDRDLYRCLVISPSKGDPIRLSQEDTEEALQCIDKSVFTVDQNWCIRFYDRHNLSKPIWEKTRDAGVFDIPHPTELP